MTYDPVGNRLTVREFDGTLVTHGYDDLYRLILDQRNGSYAFNRTYTYDEVGNRLTKSDFGALSTYGYDPADELLRVGPAGANPTTFTSDANGNVVSEVTGTATTNYTFDTENRLTKVVPPTGYTEENLYSQDGLRRARLVGTSRTTFLWDDHVLLRDNAIYTTLPGVTGGLLAAKSGATHKFYVPDMQGNVRQVTDVNGGIIAAYLYDAWGVVQDTTQSAMAFGDWGYTWDGKPGRYYVQQRHLRVDLGRWMSLDPVETEPPYGYVGNRPTWGVDPSGKQSGSGQWEAWGRFHQERHQPLDIPFDVLAAVLRNGMSLQTAMDALFDFEEALVRVMAERMEGAYRGVRHRVPFVDLIANKLPVPTPLGLLNEDSYNRIKAHWAGPVRALAPPAPTDPAFISWDAGFVWGIVTFVKHSVGGSASQLLGPTSAVLEAIELLRALPDIWGEVGRFLSFLPLRVRVAYACATQPSTPFDAGKTAGIGVAWIVSAWLIIRQVLQIAREFGAVLRECGGLARLARDRAGFVADAKARFSQKGRLTSGEKAKIEDALDDVESSRGAASRAPSRGASPAAAGTWPGRTTEESVRIKLREYLLNKAHPQGASKADWFDRALGFTEANSELLAAQIVWSRQDAVATALTQFGQKYEQMIPITGTNGRRIAVKFVWIENPDHVVRLVTAEPTKVKGE